MAFPVFLSLCPTPLGRRRRIKERESYIGNREHLSQPLICQPSARADGRIPPFLSKCPKGGTTTMSLPFRGVVNNGSRGLEVPFVTDARGDEYTVLYHTMVHVPTMSDGTAGICPRGHRHDYSKDMKCGRAEILPGKRCSVSPLASSKSHFPRARVRQDVFSVEEEEEEKRLFRTLRRGIDFHSLSFLCFLK